MLGHRETEGNINDCVRCNFKITFFFFRKKKTEKKSKRKTKMEWEASAIHNTFTSLVVVGSTTRLDLLARKNSHPLRKTLALVASD